MVVGDIDGGDAGVFADVADLETEVVAEFGVEVGEWFVEEENGGFDDYCSRQSDALLLSAGELSGFAVGVLGHLDGFECFHDAVVLFFACDFADIESEGDILGDGHVGPERVGLEDHAGVAFVGWVVGDDFVVEGD